MLSSEYFSPRPESSPKIYAYSDESFPGCLKIGYTTRDVKTRVQEQYPIATPRRTWKIALQESAIRADGTTFTDKAVHARLERVGVERVGGEWFRCDQETVKSAIISVRDRAENVENRSNDFKPRPEQEEAVERAANYFRSAPSQPTPKFLWNAKMRFGKTFATYRLAKKLGLRRVLILTFKPAVQSAWREDLTSHVDFEGWQFIARPSKPSLLEDDIDKQYVQADKSKPIVCFGSFQDFLGFDKKSGKIKPKNEWVHTLDWDLVVFDEYHFGAWRDSAKALFEETDEEKEYETQESPRDEIDRANWLPITTKRYLYLSGTPFRALGAGEFIEEQIYNWTYLDEQRAKKEWNRPEPNPYRALPQLVLMTYRLPDALRKIAEKGEFNEFDLNEFFAAEGEGAKARFVHEEQVQKWLHLIRSADFDELESALKLGARKATTPFSDVALSNVLTHTLWFLPNVASCFAMKNLIDRPQNVFFQDYAVNVCAGAKAGVGLAALAPVEKSMRDPLKKKTITLTCGKLTTGVTIKPWTGIFMLRNLSSPETYFQAAFRVQSPWEIDDETGGKTIMKERCYVFDFALDRALKLVAEYGCRLSVEEKSPEKKVEETLAFLPVLACDGGETRSIDAREVLDYALSGVSGTLLARRWESPLLVNVDVATLDRLLKNDRALNALANVEGLRALKQDIETVIARSEFIRKTKQESSDEESKSKRKELTDAEKEYKSKRKEIQEKLIKFATRVPIFMYLSDRREETLQDVIAQIEPRLFEKTTGLTPDDFELLSSLGVFNKEVMNDAVYKFKRYEDSSLSYAVDDYYENGIKSAALEEEKALISPEEYRAYAEEQRLSTL